MEFLPAYTTLRPFSHAALPSPLLSFGHSSVPRRGRWCGRPRKNTCARASPAQLRSKHHISAAAVHEKDAVTGGLVEQEMLFTEDLGQTVYIEKGTVELNNAVPLRHAEVVVEPPSVSLVRTAPRHRHRPAKRLLAEIVSISLPALGTLLADPLMSLVDTACVGQIESVQLAALGPCTAIFGMTFAAFSFIAVALANRMARTSPRAPGLSKIDKERRRGENETSLCHTLILATAIGCCITGFLYAFGPCILRWMGTSAVSMVPALQYLYVRGIAAPAVMFASVSQGACLGQQDMWTPMRVMLTAGLVNLLGDIAFIMFMGYGTIGAAAATSLSQVAAAVYFFKYLRKGVAGGKGVQLKWKGLPTMKSIQPILDMGKVLVIRSLVLALTFHGMTTVATTMGVCTVAAHQIVLQLSSFMATAIDALSLTAQAILARDQHDTGKVRETANLLMKFGASTGVTMASLFGAALTLFPQCFTTDPAIISTFQAVIPHGMLTLFLLSLCVTFEGICVGIGKIEHFPRIILPSTSSALGCLWVAHRWSLGLSGIWTAAIIFCSVRCLLHLSYVSRNWHLMPFRTLAQTYKFQLQLA